MEQEEHRVMQESEKDKEVHVFVCSSYNLFFMHIIYEST